MQSSELREILQPQFLIERIIWGAFNGSILSYGVVLYVVAQKPASEPMADSAPLEQLFYVIALGVAIGAYFYRRHAFAPERLQKFLFGELSPQQFTPKPKVIDPKFAAQLEALPQNEQRLVHIAKYLLSRNIFGLAFHEIIAILGLILGFLSQNVLSFVPFAIATLGLNLFIFPRTERLLQQLQMRQY